MTVTTHDDIKARAEAVINLPIADVIPARKKRERKQPKSHQRLRTAALKVANEVRAMLGLSPVKELQPGKMQDPTSCAIAKTLLEGLGPEWSARAGYGRISLGVRGDRSSRKGISTPYDARRFMDYFDTGYMPDLDIHQQEAE